VKTLDALLLPAMPAARCCMLLLLVVLLSSQVAPAAGCRLPNR